MSPPTERRMSGRSPVRTSWSATSTASRGSSVHQPVTFAAAKPARTPALVTTSVRTCRPSASSATERSARPRRRRYHPRAPLQAEGDERPRHPLAEGARGRRVPEPRHRLAQDEPGGDEHHRALQHRGEILGLAVPEGVVGVGRHRGVADRGPHREGGHHVDDRLQRVRAERDRARHPPRHRLQREDGDARGHAHEGGALGRLRGSRVGAGDAHLVPHRSERERLAHEARAPQGRATKTGCWPVEET